MKSLRQVVVAARDIEKVEADCRAVLGIDVAYRDPGVGYFGLVNAVMPVGTTFLEVVSPVRDDATAARFLDRRGGDAGYMVMFQTDDLAGDRARAERLGIRVVFEATLEDVASFHLHPGDTGGAIISLDQPVPKESWRWAGPGWQGAAHTDVVDATVGVELAARDPAALAARWADVLGVKHAPRNDGYVLALDGSSVRVVPASDTQREGLVAFDFRARNAARAADTAKSRGLPVLTEPDGVPAVLVAGTRFRLV